MNTPLNDLILIEIITEKDGDFVTPDRAKMILRGKVLTLGSSTFLTSSGYEFLKSTFGIAVGDTVTYRRVAEERQNNPAIRTRRDDGKEVLLISILDLIEKIDPENFDQ